MSDKERVEEIRLKAQRQYRHNNDSSKNADADFALGYDKIIIDTELLTYIDQLEAENNHIRTERYHVGYGACRREVVAPLKNKLDKLEAKVKQLTTLCEGYEKQTRADNDEIYKLGGELASWRKALEKGIEQTEMQCERNPACGDYEDCIPCAIALPMKKALKPTEE